MKFTFQRDRVITSKFGHSIFFPKGVPTHVPPEMIPEVVAAGGVSDEEVDLDPPKQPTGKTEPVDPVERKKAIFAAFEAIALRNRREEFTAAGVPHGKALARELGWQLPNAERDLLWVEFNNRDKLT